MAELAGIAAAGLAAGLLAGLLGVGGGVLFVPALALLFGTGQLEAEATSLLAIVPVAAVGAVRQHRYGNVRLREGLALGVLALAGAAAGVAAANELPEELLESLFALLLLAVAAQLARRALGSADPSGGGGKGPRRADARPTAPGG